MTTPDFRNKTVAVLGIGISNTPLIGWLLDRGARVTARDRKDFDDLPAEVRALADRGVTFLCGRDTYLRDLTEEILFKSPGIRYDLPEIAAATARGSLLTSEMELFFSLCPCKIIGVTGSDGKTTTTTLIHRCLSAVCGEDKVFVGGNIGKPLLPELERMTPDCFAVVELSSFQLHTMRQSPDYAIITNISPNHLDYHKDMAEYIDAKANIFRRMKKGSLIVLNGENAFTKALGASVPEGVEVRYFLTGTTQVENDCITCDGVPVLPAADILIPGRHNVENYAGVIALLRDLVPMEVIRRIAMTFGGVEHRIELVRALDGVKYYNSSIDSSPTRTAAALSSFAQKLIVICGGYDKHIPFEPLARSLCRKAKAVILTGATAAKIKAALTTCPDYREGAPAVYEDPDFTGAVLLARKIARPGDIVILSPACASFDAFPNFEVRGNTFKSIVKGFSHE